MMLTRIDTFRKAPMTAICYLMYHADFGKAFAKDHFCKWCTRRPPRPGARYGKLQHQGDAELFDGGSHASWPPSRAVMVARIPTGAWVVWLAQPPRQLSRLPEPWVDWHAKTCGIDVDIPMESTTYEVAENRGTSVWVQKYAVCARCGVGRTHSLAARLDRLGWRSRNSA